MFERLSDEGLAETPYLFACPRTRPAGIIHPMQDGVHVINVSNDPTSCRMLN